MIDKKYINSILYLGDSVIESFSENDADKRSIASYMEESISQKIVPVTHAAYQLSIYSDYVKHLVKHNKPKLIIIPINMRSFSAEWDTKPEYQFNKESFLLNNPILSGIIYKPICIYTNYFKETNKNDWLNSNVYDNNVLVGKVKDFQNSNYVNNPNSVNMKNKIIFHYRYNLTADHIKIMALKNICSLAKKHSQKVLFYITPLDIDFIDSVYEGTSELIGVNVSIVKGVITSYGLTVVDLSHSIPSDYFDWKVNIYPNEHMNEKGRRFVANKLLRELRKIDYGESSLPIASPKAKVTR